MENKFDQLCEAFVIKNTTRMFYPKNLKFSPAFLEAFKKEYINQKKVVKESKGSFGTHFERMLKGLRFEAKKIEDELKGKPVKEGRTIGPTPAASRMKAQVQRAESGRKVFARGIPAPPGIDQTSLSAFAHAAAKDLKEWYGIRITPQQVKKYLFTRGILHDHFSGDKKDPSWIDTMTRDMLADEAARKFGNKKSWPNYADNYSEEQMNELIDRINSKLGHQRF